MQPTVHDLAAYALQSLGPMRSMKLQKLVYYGQAWHLAWAGEPIFSEPIQGWKDGPITRALWNRHKGRDLLRKWDGNPDALAAGQRSILDRVFSFYGNLSGDELSLLTHSENPWRDSREGLQKHESGAREITHQAMREFYRQASTLIDSDNLETMLRNLVRRLPDGSWGINRAHPQPLYIGYATRLIAPLVVSEAAL